MKKIFLYLFCSSIINLSILYPAYGIMDYFDVVIAPQEINFNLKDQYGNITGYTQQGILRQIPNLTPYNFGMKPNIDESFVGYYDRFHYIAQDGSPAQVQSGRYIMTIYGSTTPIIAKIGVEFGIIQVGYSKIKELPILVYPNSIWTYEFIIPDTPPADHSIILTKVAQPSDLITDLTTAGQLGYIGSSEFVSEITQKINKIEKERLEPQKPDDKSDKEKKKDDKHKFTPAQKAKKEYTELLSEITEKYNKPEADEYVKQEAYTVLREDIEYIINHL